MAEGFPTNDLPGELSLPRRLVNVALPPNADLSSLELEISSIEIEHLPSTYNIPRNPPDTNSETMATDSTPSAHGSEVEIVQLLSTSQMRKWRFARLVFHPFQVEEASGQLSVIKQAQIHLHYTFLDSSQDDALLNDTVMDDLAAQMLFNFDQARDWYPIPDKSNTPTVNYDYVIITTNDIETYSDKLDDFIIHKQNHGFSVLTVTEDDYGTLTGQSPNGTAEKIRKWLQDNYTTYSIQYVLLVGDPDPDNPDSSDTVGDVPMKHCFPKVGYDSPTDYFYADLTGNWNLDGDSHFGEYSGDFGTGGVDFAPEVYVGRIPVYDDNYTNLDNILQKTINYENESNPYGWRKSSLLPMSYSQSGYDGAPLAEQMMDDFLDAASFSNWTQYQQGTGVCPADNSIYASSETLRGGTIVRDRWKDHDYGLVLWWGHGSDTAAAVGYTGCEDGILFQSSYTSSLDDSHPSFVYQNSCTNGYPEVTGNLQYSILKQGGVATVGATRVSWYNSGVGYGDFDGSTTNSGIGYEYASRLVQGQSASQALYNTKNSMSPEFDTRVMNYYDFNLYGDPAVTLLPLLPPTNLNVTTISQDRIDLNWTDNSLSESGFRIERSENGTTGWTQIDTVGANQTTYASTGLSCGTTYYFRVRAYNSWVNSPYSNVDSDTTLVCPPGPFNKTSPTNNATGVSINPTLSWGTSSDAYQYEYCYDTINNSACDTAWTTEFGISASLSGLANGTPYYWQVRASNPSGTTYANGGTWWKFTTVSEFKNFLPLLLKSMTGSSTLVNGDFEQGSSVGWEVYSYNSWPVIMSTASGYPITPHGGDWAAWLGRSDAETAYLRQDVTITAGDSNLHLWYQIDSEDICGYDFGHVLVDGNYEHTWDLCGATSYGTWAELTLDLSAYAGQTVTLEILVTSDYIYTSNLYIDDFSFDP